MKKTRRRSLPRKMVPVQSCRLERTLTCTDTEAMSSDWVRGLLAKIVVDIPDDSKLGAVVRALLEDE